MSTTRGAAQMLRILSRLSPQCSRRSIAKSPTTQRRALSNSPNTARLQSSWLFPAQENFKTSSARSAARRTFSSTQVVAHGDISPPKAGEELYVTFVDKDGDEFKIAVSKGDNLLDVAQANDIEMEGACGGSCACSTCHVIVEDEKLYDSMPEPDDDENDMLDLAFGLTETSRLGCQVVMSKELDGLRVKLPSMTRNLQASDFSKKNERSD